MELNTLEKLRDCMLNLSPEINRLTGISDSDVKVIACSGYGNAQMLRGIIKQEKPDTDTKNSYDEDKEEEDSHNFSRFQLVEFSYKNYNPGLNGVTELQSIMKIDSHSGETWLFKINGQERYWEKIN